MGLEIERKFLVKDNSWQGLDTSPISIRQGYLQKSPKGVVRIRLANNKGFLTIKGPTIQASRLEFEYLIPEADALDMMKNLCPGIHIEKMRHHMSHKRSILFPNIALLPYSN